MTQKTPSSNLIQHLNDQISLYFKYEGIDISIKNRLIYQIFQYLIEEICAKEKIDFTTLFSRISFIGTKYKIPGKQLFLLHQFRQANQKDIQKSDSFIPQLGVHLVNWLCHHVYKQGLDQNIDTHIPSKYIEKFDHPTSYLSFERLISGVIIDIDTEQKTLKFQNLTTGNISLQVLYDIKGKNEQFTKDLERIPLYYQLPIECNLIDVEIDKNGIHTPRAFVLSPDFLIDVTAIANCYSSSDAQSLYYLLNKFKPYQSSVHLILGNIVNFFLDEIVRDKKITFQALLPAIFALDPLGFSLLNDADVVSMLRKAENHFNNLLEICWADFSINDIKQKDIYLEPSFFSRDYGLQGRLDILHNNTIEKRLDIVELKSGKVFKPNIYGLNQSHYVQTLLYDLMMQSVSNHKQKARSYILYSQDSRKGLRYAPLARAQQLESLNLRNSFISIEQILARIDKLGSYNILQDISVKNFPSAAGFNLTDIKYFEKVYEDLDEVEKSYFHHFVAFIAREHKLAKLGSHGLVNSNGQASLWLESFKEKEERFALLKHLRIINNEASKDRPFITLKKTNHTSKLANFRAGDIIVLYPNSNDDQPMLKHQIFKCSLVEIKGDEIIVLLRNKQNNLIIFDEYEYWNIEPDMLDKSFTTMYKNLFQFAASKKNFRNLMLSSAPLAERSSIPIQTKWYTEGLSENMKSLLVKMLNTKQYFLLWGPPGTGKTSIMIKYLVKNLFENTTENILLLAYTNRAVDEICDAIVSISNDYMSNFIRIGSSYSSASKYQDILLQNKTKTFQKRKALKSYLESKRIYVSTVSSMIGRDEIFKLKSFDTLIIDEASQILEPMIIGLLPKVRRFLLIGDHKQLPAVVVQKPEQSKISDPLLNKIGLTDCRMSLFERLYLNAKTNNCHWLFDTLNYQGRMHEELMSFPNQQFYESELKIIPTLERLISPFPFKINGTPLQGFLASHRRIFLATSEVNLQNTKTNEEEAENVIMLIEQLQANQYFSFGKKNHYSIGIITPYRAQIALIKSKMEKLSIDMDNITVDTVERYQGGSRDIIIISFCINSSVQMKNLVSLSSDGTDRKLNVALTRAKEQIILIGNKELLDKNPVYKQLVWEYERWEDKK